MGEKRKADDAKHSPVTKIAKFELENSEGEKKLGCLPNIHKYMGPFLHLGRREKCKKF